MAKYQINNQLATTPAQQNVSSTFKTMISVNSSSTVRRGKLYDLTVGTNGTPADQEMEYDVSRMTAAGTGTSSTPNPLDPGDAAALTVGVINYTAEPTVTANSGLLFIAANVRATVRWVAAPGSELLWPATNVNGLVCRARSAGYVSTVDEMAYFEEL